MATRSFMVPGAAALGILLAVQPALGGSHTWRINEVFSTADGSIQFIELWEAFDMDGEIFMTGHDVTSLSTGEEFIFPAQLVGPTADKYLLLATQSFADLPGAPTPDYIIEPGFVDPTGDTLSYFVYDDWTFGALPTDCVSSLHRNLRGTPSTGPNSPTNFSGETGTIDACPTDPADFDGDGDVDGFDLAVLLGDWGKCADPRACVADLDGNGVVNGFDLALLLGVWG